MMTLIISYWFYVTLYTVALLWLPYWLVGLFGTRYMEYVYDKAVPANTVQVAAKARKVYFKPLAKIWSHHSLVRTRCIDGLDLIPLHAISLMVWLATTMWVVGGETIALAESPYGLYGGYWNAVIHGVGAFSEKLAANLHYLTAVVAVFLVCNQVIPLLVRKAIRLSEIMKKLENTDV